MGRRGRRAARRVREGAECRCTRRRRRSATRERDARRDAARATSVADDARRVGACCSRWRAARPSRSSRSRTATPTACRCACTGRRPTTNLPIVVYFHGGGWAIGSVEQFDLIARQLANASGAIVVSVDYRLAPEHPFPAPLDDCWRALAVDGEARGRARRRRVRGSRSMGDSAGGNLAAVCALLRARRGRSRARAPGARLSRSSTATSTPRRTSSNGEGYLLDARADAVVLRLLHGRRAPIRPTGGSRRCARPTSRGVAPAVVITAEYDPLRDEGEAYARPAARGRCRRSSTAATTA